VAAAAVAVAVVASRDFLGSLGFVVATAGVVLARSALAGDHGWIRPRDANSLYSSKFFL